MTDALLWNELGNIYIRIGSPGEAIAAYSKAIELDPDSGWLYCNLGHAYFLAGEFGQALFLFRKSIPLLDTPENQAIVWNKIGDAYRALKDIDNAILAYKKADDLDMGKSPAASKAAGNSSNPTIYETVKTERAVPELRNFQSDLTKKATPNGATPESKTLENGSQSLPMRKTVVEKAPPQEHPDAKLPFSLSLKRMVDPENKVPLVGDNQNASPSVKETDHPSLLREKPFIVITGTNIVNEPSDDVGTPKGESTNGVNSVEVNKKGEIQEGKPESHANVPHGKDNLEEILAKVNIYENITRVNPTSDRAWDTLGKLYKSLGRYKDAIGAYQKAIEIAPDREVYYYYLGLLYSVEQQHDDAVRAFLFVLRKNPGYVLAHSALAGVYHRMGLENKANHHIATALPKMNNESAYNRACFYAICGDSELAFEFLRLALMNKDTTIEWIKSDPDLDPIRTDPRYLVLISEKEQPSPEKNNENYFSSEVEGTQNQLLPILNHSLAR
jgi:tetratricopeptide (TPR) repeat protein